MKLISSSRRSSTFRTDPLTKQISHNRFITLTCFIYLHGHVATIIKLNDAVKSDISRSEEQTDDPLI